ncbi:MAG: pro-sigmaK processing inhibitor BofA family protein [Lachnospiraceae bacterium]|nr:pro-sigmaK processing inhibitor BofA family protein [Lachnospiraceae bacterium]MBO5283397.1 pro-sigmaK processing inhibitor BofA family protein [Lachnospiraceae bacterium]
MENTTGVFLIAGVCVIVLFMGAIRTKAEWLMNLVMRSILGTIAMYFINEALAFAGISLSVGINGVTVLTSGILGFPGILALYGIGLYKLL